MKHASYLALFSACLLLATACENAGTRKTEASETAKMGTTMDMDKAKEAIRNNLAKFEQEFERGDSNALAAHYGPEAWVMPPNDEKVTGKDIAPFWGSAIRMGVKDLNLNIDDLSGNEDWMVETGRYEMYGADKKLMDKGKYVVAWKRDGNDWKIYRDIWNTNMPAAPSK